MKSTKYESPVKFCHRCKKMYIDKDCIELGLEVSPLDREKKILPLSIWIFLLGAPFFTFGGEDVKIGIVLWCIAGLIVFLSLRSYPRRIEDLKQALAESEERLKDVEYLMILKDNGYYISDKYWQLIKNNYENGKRIK